MKLLVRISVAPWGMGWLDAVVERGREGANVRHLGAGLEKGVGAMKEVGRVWKGCLELSSCLSPLWKEP